MILSCGQRGLDLSSPRVMGILNTTPDSFSDGGRFVALDAALCHVESLLAEGADIIDIGGESTRPGAAPVTEQQELDRVLPVIEAVVQRFDVLVSVDTSTAQVMREAVCLGAGMINDVRALQRPGALQAAAESPVAVCLMHMQGQPSTMQQAPQYQDVVQDVVIFLQQRIDACVQAGIDRQRLLIDPGFGFGKSVAHNYRLLAQLAALKAQLQLPVLVGMSRKSMIAAAMMTVASAEASQKGVVPESRELGSAVAAVLAVERGADIVRVHDVRATRQALSVWQQLAQQE